MEDSEKLETYDFVILNSIQNPRFLGYSKPGMTKIFQKNQKR